MTSRTFDQVRLGIFQDGLFDGHGKQLELRPEASTDVKEVVNDLIKLFEAVSNLRVCVKGDVEPLGGHIHFGILSKSFTGTLGYSDTIKDLLVGVVYERLRGQAIS